jgi:hypothetical protein
LSEPFFELGRRYKWQGTESLSGISYELSKVEGRKAKVEK